MRTSRCRVPVVVVVLVLLAATAAWAQEPPKNAFRLGVAYHQPQGETTVEETEFGDLDLDWDSATGWFVAYERRFSGLLGLELMYTRSEPDWNVTAPSGDSMSDALTFSAATAGLNIHFFGRGAIDLYAAPLVGYAFFGSSQDVDFGDAFMYGAAVGIDIGLGKGGFALTGSVRYLKTESEVEDENLDIAFDPLIINAGVAFRF